MALGATTALAGAVPRPCVRGARGRFGGFGPVPGVVSLPFPPSRPACSALRVAGRPVRVSLTLARWYTIPRGLCVPRARSGCPSGSPRPLRVCALALPRRPPPPPLVGVACAPRAVPAPGAGRAVPRGPCPSACPAPVPCSVWRALGGGGPVLVPPYLAWGCGGGGRASPGGVPSTVARGVWGQALPLPRLPAHWAGCWGPLSTCCGRGRAGVGALLCTLGLHALWGLRAAGRVRGVRVPGGGLGGGGARAPCPPFVRPGGPVGRGSLCLVPSLCIPWAGNKAGVTGVLLSKGGVAPHTTPVRARPPSLGAICAASWRVGAGSSVLRGSCGSRRLVRGGGPRSGSSLGRGEGGPSPLPRRVGTGAPAACGPVGGVGGGVRAAASLLLLWVAARGTPSWPPSCRRRTPVRRARAVGVAGPPWGWGG